MKSFALNELKPVEDRAALAEVWWLSPGPFRTADRFPLVNLDIFGRTQTASSFVKIFEVIKNVGKRRRPGVGYFCVELKGKTARLTKS